MKNFCLALVLALFPVLLQAQTPPVMNTGIFWQAPTQYTDGTPIQAGELEKFTLRCGESEALLDLTTDVAPTQTSYSRAEILALGLPFGTGFCNLTATTTNGLTSSPSATASFLLEDTRTPEAPVLTVQ